jgi:undecaprenyl diphosphate synthase
MIDPDEIAPPGSAARTVFDRLDLGSLPRHIAFIMDGNGRWARKRHLPRVEGHRAGIKAVRETIETSGRLGLEAITLYAFSTENWKRPRHEVMTLMGLLKEFVNRELDRFQRNNMRFKPIGRIDQLEASVQDHLTRAVEATTECTGTLVQIALNYSGRQEITDLLRETARRASAGELEEDCIDEAWVSKHLTTGGTPDPDLLVRTSGEQRLSNFLLWQLAYSEIYFAKVLWPDFSRLELLEAIHAYQQRDRRFGGLNEPDAGGLQ